MSGPRDFLKKAEHARRQGGGTDLGNYRVPAPIPMGTSNPEPRAGTTQPGARVAPMPVQPMQAAPTGKSAAQTPPGVPGAASKPDGRSFASTAPQQAAPQTERIIAPQPVGGHALYRELMRSHDRMGTRHIRN